jgi:hypothetical protein
MPTYRVLEKSFINDAIREEGEIVEYDGKPGSNLELVDGSDEQGKSPKRKWEKKSQANEEQNEVEGSV